MSRLRPKLVKMLHRTIWKCIISTSIKGSEDRCLFQKHFNIRTHQTQIVTAAQGRSQARTPFDLDKEKDLHGHGHGHQHDTIGQTQVISTPHIGI
jgi:hypothetical protein